MTMKGVFQPQNWLFFIMSLRKNMPNVASKLRSTIKMNFTKESGVFDYIISKREVLAMIILGTGK